MDRVLIAGTHSGCGKTTVFCALLSALKRRGLSPSAFKCGPDYIDPMFHRRALGVPGGNLDPFFSPPRRLRQRLSPPGGPALLEGAMGYYDGVGPGGRFSAWDVARETATPAVLVIDARGMYASAGAVLRGFLGYRSPSQIRGVIFNNASRKVYDGLRELAEQEGVRPLGFLPRTPGATLASRHLGLVTAAEIEDLEGKLTLLGSLAEEHLDLDGLLALAGTAPALDEPTRPLRPIRRVRVAVARDEAFCFLYEETLELLSALGCEPVFFSPLRDGGLPPGIGGLYLCGGYPELYLEALSANAALRAAVRGAVEGGMPAVAECGGFLYLHDTLEGYPMAGVIHARAFRTPSLRRFGYAVLRAGRDNLLCAAGEEIPAHEFHYYDSTDCGGDFTAEKPVTGVSWPCVHAGETLYAGFPHLYLDANPVFAENFLRKAMDYAAKHPS